MDLKKLLAKIDLLEGTMASAEKSSLGPKFTGKWKGTDAGTPGNKMVGSCEESILKDLSKGPTPKTKEQELAEQFEAFLNQLEEENLGVNDKRPGRTSDRPAREYTKDGEQSKRYHYEKDEADESRGHKIVANKLKDIERKIYIPTPAERREQERIAREKGLQDKQQIKEFGATSTGSATSAPVQASPEEQKNAVAAATQLKSATGSPAPATNLLKAIDSASQGKAVSSTDMTALQPTMDVIKKAATDPKLASQFKNLAAQAKNIT